MVRMTLTEPKAAFAGVMLQISFARFRVSMVTLNIEMVPPRPLGRWRFACMIEGRGIWEKRRVHRARAVRESTQAQYG